MIVNKIEDKWKWNSHNSLKRSTIHILIYDDFNLYFQIENLKGENIRLKDELNTIKKEQHRQVYNYITTNNLVPN